MMSEACWRGFACRLEGCSTGASAGFSSHPHPPRGWRDRGWVGFRCDLLGFTDWKGWESVWAHGRRAEDRAVSVWWELEMGEGYSFSVESLNCPVAEAKGTGPPLTRPANMRDRTKN